MKVSLLILFTSSLVFQSSSFAQTANNENHHLEKATIQEPSLSPKDILSNDEIVIKNGAGSFLFSGGHNREDKIIEVHYYKPKDYHPDFKVMMVIPGGGRNGDDYRDTWIELAKNYDLLILSPSYSEEFYPGHITYNLGGMVENPHSAILKDLEFAAKDEWIFLDFDRIFDAVVKSLGSIEKEYDIFGHSAGGQIVHRLIFFHPEAKINRALAANSGWYTTPEFSEGFPYGLKNSPITEKGFEKSLGKKLIVFLGDLDNANETRGHLRTTPEAMRQGPHRFARGNYFCKKAIEESERLGFDISWKKEVVKGVGHSYKEMGAAAAKYLYESSN